MLKYLHAYGSVLRVGVSVRVLYYLINTLLLQCTTNTRIYIQGTVSTGSLK